MLPGPAASTRAPRVARRGPACRNGRAAGIPARIGFADVRNHLATRQLLDYLGSNLFVYHGYADLFLEGKWVKATPAFNLSLCERFGLHPLEFNGRDDSIYHEFDKAGNRHMEYVHQRGAFDDMPLAQMVADFERTYGQGRIMVRYSGTEQKVRVLVSIFGRATPVELDFIQVAQT